MLKVGKAGKVLMVRCKVTTLSQPPALVRVWVGVADEVYVVPYQLKLPHADAVLSPLLGTQGTDVQLLTVMVA